MAVIVFLLIVCLSHLYTDARSIEDAEHGCAAPYGLPNMPFFVVWNIPSVACERLGINLNMSAYGIVVNNQDQFMGEKITIFYNMGPWPRFTGTTPVNGGLPQQGNLQDFLTVQKRNIDTYIRNTNFDGLGVIDMEIWRPYYFLNYGAFRIYQTKSLELVKQQHPTWTDQTQIREEAVRSFDAGARLYMQTALQQAIELRPKGYWGYYGFPSCYGQSSTGVCAGGTTNINDNFLSWMFAASTALYPRIYTNRLQPIHSRHLYVREQVNETLRIQVKWTAGLNVPIMPYTLEQDTPTDFFTKEDLQVAIEEPADMGASGAVIWGSSSYFHTHGECDLIKSNIKNVLGPFVKNLTEVSLACANDLCHGYGRCVRKDYEATTQDFLRLYQKKSCVRPREEYENISSRRQSLFGESWYLKVKKYDNYVCRCLAGYHGEFCDKTA